MILVIAALLPVILGIAYATDFKIVAVGDIGCKSDRAKDSLNLLQSLEPDLFVALGDLSYDSNDNVENNCFVKEIQEQYSINKTKVTIGNHDDKEVESDNLMKFYIREFTNKVNKNLTPYYSFDYGNVQFLSLYTSGDFEEEKETIFHKVNDTQYQFAERDLKNVKDNNLTQWTVVFFHKPMYTSESHHDPYEQFSKVYHPLFDKYGVDLVLQGHNHAYERTLPLEYNKVEPSKPKITSNNESSYTNPPGQIYITSGAAGADKPMKKYAFQDKLPFSANQSSEIPGILVLEVKDKSLIGRFLQSQDGKELDKFQILKR